jgi:acetyl esterase
MSLKNTLANASAKIPVPVLAASAKALFALPTPVKRLLGTPQRIDGHDLDLDAQLILWLLKLQGGRGFGNDEDIARARLTTRAQGLAVGAGTAPQVGTRELTVDGAAGPLPARLYTPAGLAEGSPLMVFFHGGGFVLGDLDSHDAPCRYLAEHGRLRVLSVDYRLAPEHVFPAAADDAVAATRWARAHAGELGGDPERLVVCGDSAGGNLSAVAARELALAGEPGPVFALLLYPVTGADPGNISRDTFAEGFFLTKESIDWFDARYTPEPGQNEQPKFHVLGAEVPAGLCRTHVMVAGFDPLRDEGLAYADKLRAAGVDVTSQTEGGQIHGFINTVGVSASARAGMDRAISVLRNALLTNKP